jgi:hypothetical protein
VGMPLQEAVRRAGALETLLSPLWEGRILARHGGLYVRSTGGPVKTTSPHIPSAWWKHARDIDPKAGRAIFPMDFFEVLAIGIELEAAAVEALWPKPPGRKRGAKPLPVWPKVFAHLDAEVTANGRFPSLAAAADAAALWLKDHKFAVPDPRTIERKIKELRPDSWAA